MKSTSRQLRMARVALGMSVQQGRHLTDAIHTLRRFYESQGIEFGDDGWVRHRDDAED